MESQDPRDILAPVVLTEYDRGRIRCSPSYDLARLRWRRRRNIAPERWEKIVNLKWRVQYTEIYRKER
jgi:hypothetical protein